MSDSTSLVACPNCRLQVSITLLHPHLDACLDPLPPPTSRKRKADHAQQETVRANDGGDSSSPSVAAPTKSSGHGSDSAKRSAFGPISTQKPAFPPASSNRAASVCTSTNSKTQRLLSTQPLAERMRPRTLSEFAGQPQVIAALRAMLRQSHLPSMIFWSPPGTGKTTLARILVHEISSSSRLTPQTLSNGTSTTKSPVSYRFVELSGPTTSHSEIKKHLDDSSSRLTLTGQRTLLFIDEFQRINRGLQDLFLPFVEKGTITLVAATTENPSFRVTGALLSRMRTLVLNKLEVQDLKVILTRARDREQVRQHDHEREEGTQIQDEVIDYIAENADGDARTALNSLEMAFSIVSVPASTSSFSAPWVISQLRGAVRSALLYDRSGDHHYDTLSALHKAIRGSDSDAALYWLARMVVAGEDALLIARRLIVAAAEDCSCDVSALPLATSTYTAVQVVGLPEAAEPLAQCVLYLSECRKSTRAYRAWQRAKKAVETKPSYPVPLHIRNAPTKLMTQLEYGKGYRYEPRYLHPVAQTFLPPELQGSRFVSPDPDLEAEPEQLDPAKSGLPPGSNDPFKDDENRQASSSSSISTAVDLPNPPNLLGKHDAIGAGACQRIFEVGSRVVDLDLLQEWETEQNNGKPWGGRARLEELISSRLTR